MRYITAMKFRLAVLLMTSMFFSFAVSAQDSNELRLAVQDISRLRRQIGGSHEESISELSGDSKLLTSLIDRGSLTIQETAAALYWRGTAAAVINARNMSDGQKADEWLAGKAIVDFDKMIAAGIEYPRFGATVNDALYMAGSVAKLQLHMNTLAYTYWEKCAARDHAGCLNIMASARLTGEGGLKVDIQDAIANHMKVFNTGIQFRCAGAFSAQSIAAIGYFTGVATPLGDELVWTSKSRELMDLLAAREKNDKQCGRSDMIVGEFLFKLARGNRQEKLLEEATAHLDAEADTTRAVIGLLSGKTSPLAFSAAVDAAKMDSDKCSAYFDAFWYEELTKNHDLAKEYLQKISAIEYCSVERVYAKKFSLAAESKPD